MQGGGFNNWLLPRGLGILLCALHNTKGKGYYAHSSRWTVAQRFLIIAFVFL